MARSLLKGAFMELVLQRYSWAVNVLAVLLGAYLCARIVNTVTASAIAPRPSLTATSSPSIAAAPVQ